MEDENRLFIFGVKVDSKGKPILGFGICEENQVEKVQLQPNYAVKVQLQPKYAVKVQL